MSTNAWKPFPAAATAAVALAIGLAACTPYGTYPPMNEKVQVSKPSFAPFPQLMADSVTYCYETYQPDGERIFNLPEGTPAPIYHKVMERVDDSRPIIPKMCER